LYFCLCIAQITILMKYLNLCIILVILFTFGCNKPEYKLTITLDHQRAGIVNPRLGEYKEGSIIEISVTPYEGYQFVSWNGDYVGTENPLSLKMDSDKSLIAKFEKYNPIYLDTNGVTIKCYEWAEIGDTGVANGIIYTVVDYMTLRSMIKNEKDVSIVCTSKVGSMHGLLKNGNRFNQDISSWDVSHVRDMEYMFFDCYYFTGDLSKWDVSRVQNMRYLFCDCFTFESDLSMWDVSNVTDMSYMFHNCHLFNSNISNWDTGDVTNMHQMFYKCFDFNQDLSGWNVYDVTDCNNFSFSTNNWTLPKPYFYNCDYN